MPSPIFLACSSLIFAVLAHAIQSNPDAPAAVIVINSVLSLGLVVGAFRSAS